MLGWLVCRASHARRLRELLTARRQRAVGQRELLHSIDSLRRVGSFERSKSSLWLGLTGMKRIALPPHYLTKEQSLRAPAPWRPCHRFHAVLGVSCAPDHRHAPRSFWRRETNPCRFSWQAEFTSETLRSSCPLNAAAGVYSQLERGRAVGGHFTDAHASREQNSNSGAVVQADELVTLPGGMTQRCCP